MMMTTTVMMTAVVVDVLEHPVSGW